MSLEIIVIITNFMMHFCMNDDDSNDEDYAMNMTIEKMLNINGESFLLMKDESEKRVN